MEEKKPKHENAESGRMPVENSAPGLNDNFEFMGKQFHIQTEKIGLPIPRIVTQVFSNGRVVLSKKSEVSLRGHESQEHLKVEELMRAQHFQVIQELANKQKQILGSR